MAQTSYAAYTYDCQVVHQCCLKPIPLYLYDRDICVATTIKGIMSFLHRCYQAIHTCFSVSQE